MEFSDDAATGFNDQGAVAGAPDPTSRDFTSTNTQEKDVDEPDIVKNDGDYIYIIRDGKLLILDAWPANDTALLSTVPLPGRPQAMFLTSDQLMVVSTDWVEVANDEEPPSEDAWGDWWGTTTVATTEVLYINVSDRSQPVFTHAKKTFGNYLSARRVDDEVLVVTRASLDWPNDGVNRSALFGYDENMEALADYTAMDMLPQATSTAYDDEDTPESIVDGTHRGVTTSTQVAQCGNIYASDKSDANSITLFQIHDVKDPAKDTKSSGVVSGWTHLYSSTENAYLVATEWHDGGYFTPSYSVSKVHQFAAFQGTRAVTYTASGIFDGQVHNQFSMSERDGLFRVVITENPGTAGNSWDGWNSGEGNRTSLAVFEQEEGELLEVARVDNIGNDEVVQSVRFIGDKAYVVTYPFESAWNFRRTTNGPIYDPLFVIDLSEPRSPQVRGELKVPGYSTYIHPLGENHLLTVGVNSDENNMYQGMSISIFDVTDLDEATLAHRLDFGSEGSDSDALSDHHAFTYFASQGILGIPIHTTEFEETATEWRQNLTESALRLFRIDPLTTEGILEIGSLSQTNFTDEDPAFAANTNLLSCYPIRRSVMISDDEGVFAYANSH